jgi:hypothetical protein
MRVKNLLNPPPMAEEQRVEAERRAQECETEQKVINEALILTVP